MKTDKFMNLGPEHLANLRAYQDPFLSDYAQRFEQSEFVSNLILPDVTVKDMTGRYPIFGNEHMQINESARPIGSDIKFIKKDKLRFEGFALESHGLATSIDYLEKESVKGIVELQSYYMDVLMSKLLLEREKTAVDLLTNSTTYNNDCYESLTSGSEFDDADVDPIKVIKDAMETVRSKINRLPNSIIFGQPTFNAIQNNPNVLEKIKHTQIGVVTEDLLATLLSTAKNPVKIAIGTGMYEDPITQENVDLWSDVTVIGYNSKFSKTLTKYDNTFGKNFIQSGYPWAAKDVSQFGIIDLIAVLMMYKAYISNKDAGFLIANCVHNS